MKEELNEQNTENSKILLARKINENYAEYMEKWLQMQPSELICICDEIDAVTRMAKAIPVVAMEIDAEYLLRFKNPLAVISDEWLLWNGTDTMNMNNDLRDIMWRLSDTRYAESDYEMESDFYDPETETDEQPKMDM